MKKLFTLILAASMLLSLAACGGTSDSGQTPSPEPTESASPSAEPSGARDMDAAYAKFAPDTLVMTVDGSEVMWSEYFYWLGYMVQTYESYIGPIADFDEASLFDASKTWAQIISEGALNMAKQYHAVYVNCTEAGVTLSDEDEKALQDALASAIASMGEGTTEEEFFERLETEGHISRELYEFIATVPMLFSKMFAETYGENGEKITDEEALAFAEESGYLTAKHILIMTKDAEGTDLDEAGKTEKKALAEEILEKLNAAEDLEATFDELMNEHSEDTGLAYYPDGYCFGPGKMVESFETATRELEPGGLSGLVESPYGYHIILRLLTTPEDVVNIASDGSAQTLRYTAASAKFTDLTDSWMNNAEIVWQDGFETLDLNEVFG